MTAQNQKTCMKRLFDFISRLYHFIHWFAFKIIVINCYNNNIIITCLQCFDAVGWAQEGHSACKKTQWRSAGVVVCLERSADLHMAQLMPLPLTVSCFSKIQIGSTFLGQRV